MIPLVLSFFAGCAVNAEQASNTVTPGKLASATAARVEVVVLESGEAKLELDLPGEVGGERDANLAAANGGYVEQVFVSDGQEVTAGQVLAYIDASLYRAQLDQATAQLEQAEAELSRVEKLGDLASQAQIDGVTTQAKVSRASLRQAQTRLARAVIRAPFSGVVADVAVEAGESVGPGTPVIRVVQLDPAVVNLSVADRDVVSLERGMPVEVTAASRSETFDGTVSRVSPVADLRTRSFPVEVEVPNERRLLLPGMIARVKAERPLFEDAMVIPQDWIVTKRDRRGVFVVEENTAVWRDVKLGEVLHDRVLVTDGLAAGDRVVVTGHRDLVDGDALVVSREGRCCSDGRTTFGNQVEREP